MITTSPESLRTQQRAWREARELRTCPPDSQLLEYDPAGAAEALQRHVAMCPFCQERLEDVAYLREVSEAMAQAAAVLPQPVRPEVSPGQVWSVSSRLAGWNEDFEYCRAPLVLVLRIDNGPIPAALVAQVYHDDAFQGPGDVSLGAGRGFVEAWNTYSMALRDLAHGLATVDAAVVQEVLATAETDPEQTDSKVLDLFRQLEVRVGSHFSMQSVLSMVQEMEEMERQESITALFSRNSEWERKAVVTSDLHLAAVSLRPPRQAMPLAAATEAPPRWMGDVSVAALCDATSHEQISPEEPLMVVNQLADSDAMNLSPILTRVFGCRLVDGRVLLNLEFVGAPVQETSVVRAWLVGNEPGQLVEAEEVYCEPGSSECSLEFVPPCDDLQAMRIHVLRVEQG